ncbi:ELM1/GtrOC1 family putative glycosyltransferase [Methyloligella sp. 2.7D]|uniref:ELM1/GtrOC1 family putative glycosyltransferase n=1 Tax=unclassified Methyloligella TaxID=2625955 RepID=UPI00157BC03B|nr:ELM1/GtrOC1 family putative glycosyltransferase [Methyloligella sp. GL2]QKP78024.1 mitochondrial fission ELM1 family protein [Methyloligella sp. GL2]
MSPLKVLFLADSRPGHYHLSEGVIAALTRLSAVEVRRIEVNRRWIIPTRWLRRRIHSKNFFPPRMLWMTYRIRAEELPKADLVISAGGETLMPNICCSRYLGIPNIFCGSLRDLEADEFSLVISSYERDAKSPRHIVTLKPSSIDPDALGRPAEVPQYGPGNRPKLAGLLIGGDAGTFRYRRSEWKRLIEFVRAVSKAWGTRWMISTSRRTPDHVADMFGTLAGEGDVVERFIDFRKSGPGTLNEVFGKAEVLVCTEDSSTMMSEAVSARLPVVGVAPKLHHFTQEEREYRALMLHRNWARTLPIAGLSPETFENALSEIEPIEGNPIDMLAAKLKQRLPELLAAPPA